MDRLSLYRALLKAYPRALRDEHADDMAQLLGDLLRDAPARRRPAVFARAVGDVVFSAPVERLAALRTHRATALAPAGGPPAISTPPTAPAPLPRRSRRRQRSRREFLRTTLGVAAAGAFSGGAAATVGMLWPAATRGFGGLIDAGPVEDVQRSVDEATGFFPIPAARTYLVRYDAEDDPDGVYTELTAGTGVMALFSKCVHLGCKVPYCEPSDRFECPCHASRYNRWGEFQGGPAPRGLDRFPVLVEQGRLVIDTRRVVTGPSRGVDVLQEDAKGPSCAEI